MSFVENHSENFWASVTPHAPVSHLQRGGFRRGAAAGAGAGGLPHLLLRRRDFAILRAMGVPTGQRPGAFWVPLPFWGCWGLRQAVYQPGATP